MQFIELALRAAMPSSTKCRPYEFVGRWNDQDLAIVKAELDKHMLPVVDPMFNNWRITHFVSEHFVAYRATWEAGYYLSGSTAQELAEKLAKYYA